VRQWILSGVMGDRDIRDRDAEFSARGGFDKGELQSRLETTIDRALQGIRNLPPRRLTERTTVQNLDKTLLEVIYTVVEHFANHTGQIIFVTKMLTSQDLGYFK